jgi:diphthine-ammonia ligase
MMASGLNVITLVSGGKDSFFSMLHVRANGDVVVALANLHPATNEHQEDDIDSYMYQTVGHAVIPLYAEALGIPLYRRAITGHAVNSSRDYEKSAEKEQERDETEDLVPLLERVMKAHPEANAVSTGAILSTYQRTRVESVAIRLGLTPLSYLWQYPLLPPYSQTALLHDMAAVGQEAIIIKTASGGLDESLLGLDVADTKTIARLKKAMARYGEKTNGAIVGEGGEFETLALDGPRGLWKKRVVLGEVEHVSLDGGQSVLRIKEVRLEEKEFSEEGGLDALRIPDLWDDEFKRILGAAEHVQSVSATDTTEATPASEGISAIQRLPQNTSTSTPTVFTYSNLSHPGSTPSAQLTAILTRLSDILASHALPKSAINHCTLVLRSMSDFTILNPIYGSYFNFVNPPARVTISAGPSMPDGIDVMLSIILDKTAQRNGLHVQSRSYWAPANIGPYSQAISTPLPSSSTTTNEATGEIVYIAGQIPLHPASMSPYTSAGFLGQVLLSLQHLWRIGRAKNVTWWTSGVAFIPASIPHPEECVAVARHAWTRLHTPHNNADADTEDDDVDPWDRMNKNGYGVAFNDATDRAPIPDFEAVRIGGEETTPPPCFVVQIESLPRDVDVEWSATGLTASSISFDGSVSSPTGSKSNFHAFAITQQSDYDAVQNIKWASATLYVGRGFTWDEEWTMGGGVQWIPCQRVWGTRGEEVMGVVVGRVDEQET